MHIERYILVPYTVAFVALLGGPLPSWSIIAVTLTTTTILNTPLGGLEALNISSLSELSTFLQVILITVASS